MLTIEIAQRGVCGWVVIYHSYTRYPVERLATDGRRVLRYLMDSLHGPIVAGDTARLAVLAPRLRLIAPGQILASGGVSRDEEVLAAEAERRARQVGTSKSSPACVMAKAA